MNCFDIRQQQFCGGYFCIYSPPVFAIIIPAKLVISKFMKNSSIMKINAQKLAGCIQNAYLCTTKGK